MKKPLNILLAEDSPDDAEIIVHELRRAGFDPKWQRVQTEPDFLAEIKNSPDIILSDFAMPQFTGLRAAELLQASGLDIPFILISGTIGEEAAVAAMKNGVTDYLLKDRIARLGVAVEQALEKKRLRDERQHVEVSLKLFRALIDRSTDCIEVVDPETGRFLDVNETTCERLGYQREEMLAMRVPDIEGCGMDFPAWRISVEKTRQAGFRTLETRHRRKDGSTFPVEVSVRFVTLDREYLIASVRDITKRKQAEESLRETSALLEALLQNTTDHIYFKDLQSRFVRFSRELLKHFNLAQPDELEGRTDFDFFTEEHARPAFEAEQEIIRTGQPLVNLEEKITHLDGRIGWVLTSKMPWRDAAGKIIGTMGISRDITERRQIEDALHKLSQRTERRERILTTTLSNLHDFAYIFDRDGRFVFANQPLLDLWGITLEAAVGKNFFDLKYPDELARKLQRQIQQVFDTKQSVTDETPYTSPAGQPGFYEYIFSPAFAADGTVDFVAGSTRDITARKHTEKMLRDSEERFSSAFEFAPIGMALVAPEGRWLKVNRAICAIVGYSEAELLARTFQEITHPDDLAADMVNVRRLLAREIHFYEMEKRYIHERGHFVSILLDVSLVRDGRGQPLYFIAQIQDITERKRVTTALLESKRFLRSTLDALSSHITILDEHGTIIEVNAAWNRSAGDNNYLGKNYLKVCDAAAGNHSKEAPQVASGIRAVIAGQREEFQLEYPCHSPNEKRWFLVRVTRFGGDGAVRVVVAHENITERKRVEEALRESKHFIEAVADHSASFIYVFDLETRSNVYVNRGIAETLGYSPAQIAAMGDNLLPTIIHPEDMPAMEQCIADFAEVPDGRIIDHEYRMKRANGEWCWNWARESVFKRRPDGSVCQILGTAQDITERKKIEAQLVQSQKMETVGKLAGGIAHEFNSILTAIIGQSELLLNDLPAASPLKKNATEISKAASRAAKLTRQLLAYGRKQLLQPEALNLNHVIGDLEKTFQHLMGADVDVQIVPAIGLREVKADAGQIEQVIMNLVINARDAMPHGGKFTLETANVSFDAEDVGRYPELKPGDYVMLAISDNGTGMSNAVKARLFEPFFTTKGVGEGTGLGLSTCYGIIKQSGGHISVYSEEGRGTTFKIYLPQVEASAKIPVARLDAPDLPGGTETILLVEDDPALREMAATLLQRLGYTVLTAGNGVEALSLRHERSIGHIDLLFTDVVMPHMSGKELADRARALYPETKILFTSAYTENAIVHQGVLEKGVALLQKPFTPSALAHKVREALDQSKTS